MNRKGQISNILYAIGFAFFVLGGGFFVYWNNKPIGTVLAIIGIICWGVAYFLG